jgi:hypothetical protein
MLSIALSVLAQQTVTCAVAQPANVYFLQHTAGSIQASLLNDIVRRDTVSHTANITTNSSSSISVHSKHTILSVSPALVMLRKPFIASLQRTVQAVACHCVLTVCSEQWCCVPAREG